MLIQAKSSFKVSDIRFPAEIILEGVSLLEKKVKIVILLEESESNNRTLYEIGFGVSNLRSIKIGDE